MKKVLVVLASIVFLVLAYVWFSGIRFGSTSGATITAVKLYATEFDANAGTDNYVTLPIHTKCHVTKIGSKYNAVRVRCDDPPVEGWTGEFSLFDPSL
ncbi:exported hypothetical protein [Cupriavidus taiwanensis]|uniref:Uncharacterized protein n=1 Tax=Cupriavidus taiwanensis TaxID=164546 RepID=A0A375EAY9_9BURK|nr:hypothetical protein [Cupriavidus taiwanensis]SOZ18349.1 exported hypothetical protein [Cupriavidus taiwanensis]SOZ31312.1 exported hypothetical protein [Cupriavidus taiwanensis]SOZ47390.1 exported hypothetical protein [Cupriavidus taiwanensis]SOZ66624.1 exported hypothetical protein [Cupriavidus taiwanensis]SOZ67449.1 exported hypothetical protein [Cupriavidus taiwanensis]